MLSTSWGLDVEYFVGLFIATLFQHRDKGRFELHGFVVMPDHVHVLVTLAIDQSTSRCIQFIKGGYSFAARQQSPGEIWHSGYHEHRIRDADDFNNQLRYIANNPTRKQYQDYPHVHTCYLDRLDPIRLSARLVGTPGAKAPLLTAPERAKPEGLAYLEARPAARSHVGGPKPAQQPDEDGQLAGIVPYPEQVGRSA